MVERKYYFDKGGSELVMEFDKPVKVKLTYSISYMKQEVEGVKKLNVSAGFLTLTPVMSKYDGCIKPDDLKSNMTFVYYYIEAEIEGEEGVKVFSPIHRFEIDGTSIDLLREPLINELYKRRDECNV